MYVSYVYMGVLYIVHVFIMCVCVCYITYHLHYFKAT